MDELSKEIQVYRSRICRAFLFSIALMAIPALTASLSRINDIGWQPVMAVHIFIAVSLWLIVLFRKRVPYLFQASFIVFLLLVIGWGGVYQFGLAAGGVAFLVAASPIATLLFGGRVGIAVLIASLCGAAVIAVNIISGKLVHDFDVAAYFISPSSWMTAMLSWALAGTTLTVSLHVFNRNLIESLKISRQHQDDLRAHQLKLEKVIEEKDKALSEVITLRGIIPICSYCHSIRSDEGAWDKLEEYISRSSGAQFSHGICPDCFQKLREDSGLGDK